MKLSNEQKQIMDWRMQAFALQGVGTHNAWLMRKAGQFVRTEIKAKHKEIMSSKAIKNIVENLLKISEDGVQIATLAQVLVNDNPLLADRLQFVLSVEIEDKLRREEDASKV